MDFVFLLFGAGCIAGMMNAVAGGGTFVALPVLALMGLPPTVANASSTVALFPGTLVSAWSSRDEIRPFSTVSTATLLTLSLVGGLIGAVLLLVTLERIFSALIPWLLLLTLFVLAAGPRLSPYLPQLGLRTGPGYLLITQFGLGIYGGYFGGALGLMMLAVWGLATNAHLGALNPLKTLLVAAVNGAAVACFAATGNVSWREAVVVMAGGGVGGFIGARIGRRLPLPLLRAIILTIAAATTAAYFARAYGWVPWMWARPLPPPA